MQQLGVILSPYGAHSPYGWGTEIAQARGGQGTYLPQPEGYPRLDRLFNTRGEVGFYYDTQLGEYRPKTKIGVVIKAWWDRTFKKPAAPTAPVKLLPAGDGMTPTDAELAKNVVCYTPVASGWINAKEGYVPGTWRFGWNPAGPYGPQTSLSGLGATDAVAVASTATATDIFNSMNAHNHRIFMLAIISTSAVSISAILSLGIRWRRYQREHHLKRAARR